MYRPYRARVRILTPDAEEHYYTVPAELAAEIVDKGLAEPAVSEMDSYIGAVRLLVSTTELREHVFLRQTRRKRKPDLRAPDSSSGGGDQGLAPLVGRWTAMHYAGQPA